MSRLVVIGNDGFAIRCMRIMLEHPNVSIGLVLTDAGRRGPGGSVERFAEALPCFDWALDLDQRNTDAQVIRGACLVNLDRVEEGLHCCEKALDVDMEHALGWYIKAAAEQRLGRLEDAALSFRHFTTLAPGNMGSGLDN